ncbi:O-glucosyltransferase rumi homolog [Selaginella moellendorffii]|uniref:O-glucosyltransferase rumi homolog n=1 Tax=Selaginella moellendorffii TaxID=88036 RepID=UPI000D1C85A8|nr:O-glucosyltransferase rumi homolog [Selaginella moellendorffii]|eukprot:XP_024540114.1 O-glucosyltransferase rumi homolog [Selaginella moellendorffii]
MMVRVSSPRLVIVAAGAIAIATILIAFAPVVDKARFIPSAVISNLIRSRPPNSSARAIDRQRLQQCSAISKSPSQCPAYFSWIDRDLAPWKDHGITLHSLQEAKKRADFRVLILNGTLYMERYHKCFQTRDDFTLRGLQLLLDRFPGMVPDVDLMFGCGDFPAIPRAKGSDDPSPPPLFSYCTTARGENYDIVFPDWSFWGWPEVNILPWEEEKQKIYSGAREEKWSKRQRFAYWKGNYWTGAARPDLVKCAANKDVNSSRLITHHQDWNAEKGQGFKSSDMSKQCTHRYKVYVEGRGWSASLKYIMSCGSTVLFINPDFHEFFSRSLIPFVHYWPINRTDICNSIKAAVDWGNAFPEEAEAMGKCAQTFLDMELDMKFVYQYMLLLLQHYAQLLKFEPVLPEGLAPFQTDNKAFVNKTSSVALTQACTIY